MGQIKQQTHPTGFQQNNAECAVLQGTRDAPEDIRPQCSHNPRKTPNPLLQALSTEAVTGSSHCYFF